MEEREASEEKRALFIEHISGHTESLDAQHEVGTLNGAMQSSRKVHRKICRLQNANLHAFKVFSRPKSCLKCAHSFREGGDDTIGFYTSSDD